MPRTRIVRAIVTVLAPFLLYPPGVPADALRIIQLQHRPASEIAPLVRPLLGPNDALSETDFRLILRAPPKTIAEIERLVRHLDVARRQLTLSVRYEQSGEQQRSRHAVEGATSVGERSQVRLPPATDPGSGVIGDPDGIRYRGGVRESHTQLDTSQQLRVLDGASAFIRMGQSMTHVQRVLALAGNRAVATDALVVQDAITGFEVRPRMRGEHVLIEITPRVARFSDPRRAVVDFRELTTTVTVRPREWVELGQLFGNATAITRAILQRDAASEQEHWRVLLRVD